MTACGGIVLYFIYGVVLWFCGARGRSRASRTACCNFAAIVIFGTTTESCLAIYVYKRACVRICVSMACSYMRVHTHEQQTHSLAHLLTHAVSRSRSFFKLDFGPRFTGNYHRSHRYRRYSFDPSLVIRETNIFRFHVAVRQRRAG